MKKITESCNFLVWLWKTTKFDIYDIMLFSTMIANVLAQIFNYHTSLFGAIFAVTIAIYFLRLFLSMAWFKYDRERNEIIDTLKK